MSKAIEGDEVKLYQGLPLRSFIIPKKNDVKEVHGLLRCKNVNCNK
jgi:hypothetical protein